MMKKYVIGLVLGLMLIGSGCKKEPTVVIQESDLQVVNLPDSSTETVSLPSTVSPSQESTATKVVEDCKDLTSAETK